jgi:selT/selW/selH-like putative selenoprotein
LRDAIGIEARVTPGGRGQFDVVVDDSLIWSKHQRGRFPEDGEIPALLNASR